MALLQRRSGSGGASRVFFRLLAAGVLAALVTIPTPRGAHAETALTTVRVASGLSLPLYVTAPPGDTTRLFIVEQRGGDNRGRIKILKNWVVLARPFLTTAVLSSGSEQGLLGLAFAPDYATTGRFYINYTRSGDGMTIIERRTVGADPDTATGPATTILMVAQPFANHNGGWMGFGPDGYLYVAMGDGGSGGDPGDRAQNRNELLGKILRLDVSGATYTNPSTNPYFGGIAGRDEIWATGVRNPWRPSFDRVTGDFIVADVGQNNIEEVNFQPAGSAGGENYGWRCYEGFNFFSESATIPCGTCTAAGCPKIFPHYQYTHALGRCSVTGGYVYRGCAIPDLRGTYFFGDYCAAVIYSGKFSPDTLTSFRDRTAELAPGGGLAINSITSFGEDARGELYICDAGGEVFRIVPRASGVAEADMPVLRVQAAIGDTLGATMPGNALVTGVTLFEGAGNRLRGVGYLGSAAIRDCETSAGNCRTSRMRLGAFDVDVEACVDPAANKLTRRFIFTNRAGTAQNLEYVDVITPRLNGDEDGAATVAPAGGGLSATLAMYDSFTSGRTIRHWGQGSSGVTYAADVDTASQLVARIAADQPLAGGTSAGPAAVGLALSFAFGSVPPAGVESVTVFTTVHASPPSGVDETPPAPPRFAVGPVPFRTELGVHAALSRSGPVQVDVFDVQGRRVRSLFRGTLPSGPSTLRWNGRNDAGREVPAGIYFIRYAAEGTRVVRRAVRVR